MPAAAVALHYGWARRKGVHKDRVAVLKSTRQAPSDHVTDALHEIPIERAVAVAMQAIGSNPACDPRSLPDFTQIHSAQRERGCNKVAVEILSLVPASG